MPSSSKAGALSVLLALALAPQALAASKVESTGSAITFTGDATDPTTLTISAQATEADGDHVFRISPAGSVSGPACVLEGGDAICNDNASASARTLTISLGSGSDVVTNTSPVGASYQLGGGSDVLHLAPSAPVANTIDGGPGEDFFDIGLSFGPDHVLGNRNEDITDYLARTSGPVSVHTSDLVANDGASGEGDNIESRTVRGTAQAGDDIQALVSDGDLGADSIHGPAGDDLGLALVYELDTPYPRPVPGRTSGVTVNADGSNSDGDTLASVVAITGTHFADTFATHARVIAGGGDDTIEAGDNAPNTIDGGTGTDTVSYAQAPKAVTATLGTADGELSSPDANSEHDRIQNVEVLVGSPFNDRLTGNTVGATLDGAAGNDTLLDGDVVHGTTLRDTLIGGAGTDTVDYSGETALTNNKGVIADLSGGAGEDSLQGIENVTGSKFADTLTGDDGANILRGGDGDDTINGRGGADALFGEGGLDTLSYAERTTPVTVVYGSGGAIQDGDLVDIFERVCGGQGDDHLAGSFELYGLGGSDLLEGTGDPDVLEGDDAAPNCAAGAAGDDSLLGKGGADKLDGGPGTDLASYADHTAGVNVSLSGAFANSDGDTLTGIENLSGSNLADILDGDAGKNVIVGNAGDDVIDGEAGDDILNGGIGDDQIRPFTFSLVFGKVTPHLISAPGPDGVDKITGSLGDDVLDSRDTIADGVVSCGTGNDQAVIDLKDPNGTTDCETQQRAQVDMHPVADVRGRWKPVSDGGIFRIRCSRTPSKLLRRCAGRITVRASRRGRVLGRARYSIKLGHTGRVHVRFHARKGRKLTVELVEHTPAKTDRTARQIVV